MPLLLMATDCSRPAAKPFWVTALMVAVPPLLAYCVRPPEPVLNDRLPSDWLPTMTLGMVMAGVAGLVSAPAALKGELVPALTQAGVPPSFAWENRVHGFGCPPPHPP